jgi:alpha-N-arabinofuranosidase
MMLHRAIVLIAAAVALAGCAADHASAGRPPAAAQPAIDCRIVIAAKTLGPVNRRVLGTNLLAYQPDWNPDPRYGRQGAGIWDPASRAPVPEMLAEIRRTAPATLRWPGGCGVHRFDWRKAVGPLAGRPGQDFGLPEFLRCCRDLGAEPVITLADYWGEPSDFADLVEYLNAPIDANPNGGTAWAQVRAEDGHSQPYGVRWFECGNETPHGPHVNGTLGDRRSALSPAAYGSRFLAVRRAMQAVDPTVLVGAVLDDKAGAATDADGILASPWNAALLAGAGREADFLIHHAYLPRYSGDDPAIDLPAAFTRWMVAARHMDAFYRGLRRAIRVQTGRDIPLAISEYNASFVQESPLPLRYSHGAAVIVADLIGVLLKPEHGIAHAQYWQCSNEYWGAIAGYAAPYRLRPAAHVLALWQEHLGDTLLRAEVDAPLLAAAGWGGQIALARGEPAEAPLRGPARPVAPDWRQEPSPDAEARIGADGALEIAIRTAARFNYYHAAITLPARPLTTYRVRAEIRCARPATATRGAGLTVRDGRGWEATRSAADSDDVFADAWTAVEVAYTTLEDAGSLHILARRQDAAEALTFAVRNLTIQESAPANLGSTPLVAATCSRRTSDGGIVALLINRSLDRTLRTAIAPPTPAARAVATTLAGRPEATNEGGDAIHPSGLAVRLEGGMAILDLPPCSVTGLHLEGIGR